MYVDTRFLFTFAGGEGRLGEYWTESRGLITQNRAHRTGGLREFNFIGRENNTRWRPKNDQWNRNENNIFPAGGPFYGGRSDGQGRKPGAGPGALPARDLSARGDAQGSTALRSWFMNEEGGSLIFTALPFPHLAHTFSINSTCLNIEIKWAFWNERFLFFFCFRLRWGSVGRRLSLLCYLQLCLKSIGKFFVA